MPRDNQNKVSKKDQKLSKKQEDLKKKKIRDSDSDGNDGSDSEKEEMDMQEYRKFISKIFPSKHINDKIKAGEKLKKVIDEDDEDDEDDDEDDAGDDEDDYGM